MGFQSASRAHGGDRWTANLKDRGDEAVAGCGNEPWCNPATSFTEQTGNILYSCASMAWNENKTIEEDEEDEEEGGLLLPFDATAFRLYFPRRV